MSDEDKTQDLSIWQYFDKTDEAQRYAACRLCQKVYCYKTTIYNLKQHLIKQHTEDIDINPLDLRNIMSQRRSWCESVPKRYNPWDYFTQCDDVKDSASCNYCEKIFSYKRNKTNLKSHLKRAHFDQIKSILKETDDDFIKEEYLEYEDEVVENPLADEETIFERETGGRARCVLCNVSLPNQQAQLVAHLRKEHPNRAAVLEIDEEEASDSNDEDNTYTEVVYLEDNEQKKVPLKIPLKRRQTVSSTKPRIERPRRVSTDDEYQPNFKRRKEPPLSKHKFEVDNFLKYLSPLLNEIPEEQFMRLQLDIINMVMMARINTFASKAPEGVKKIPVYECNEPDPPVIITVPNLEASQSTGSRRHGESITNHSQAIRNHCESIRNQSGETQNNGELQSDVDVSTENNSLQVVDSSNENADS